ncbi:hypothetical protein ACWCRD_22650 [Streptomyces sp. NPDC002092]
MALTGGVTRHALWLTVKMTVSSWRPPGSCGPEHLPILGHDRLGDPQLAL